MLSVESAALALGLRGIDVRHEQAAAMAAHAYARLRNRPGVCMAASGPGTTNLITGVAHAFVDCTPVIALGGSSPASATHHGTFQEIDQLAMLAPCTKWSERVQHVHRIPEILNRAIREAVSGKPGPVYIDLPGDVLFDEIDEAKIEWPEPWDPARRVRPAASAIDIQVIADLLVKAEKPVVISGMGVLWSEAEPELQAFVETFWDSLLHDAAKSRRDPRGSSILLSDGTLHGLSRGRSHSDRRHSDELHHRPRGAAAIQRRCEIGPH